MRKVYLIPNMITAFGLSCGLFVIFKMNMFEGGAALFPALKVSAFFLLAAAFADLLDGAVARAMQAESEFGLIFDSLSDSICFGVAPTVLLLKSLSLVPGSWLSFYSMLGCMLYSLCGVLRLVRYNVKKAETSLEHQKNFTGLPIPGSALAAVSANLLLASPFAKEYFAFSSQTEALILSSVMIILGYFMVSRWRFPSAKALHIRLPTFQLILLTVVLAVFVLYGMLYFFPLMLALVTWSYLTIAWILSIIRLIAGRKSKTLEDYEPDEEDEV